MIFEKAKLIAEIGCNHMGDFEFAKKMIDSAVDFCGVKYVKFQKRNNKELLSEEQYNAPHPSPSNSYGNTYGNHREFLEFSLAEHKELKRYCETKGVIYFSSVWDLTSAKEIASLKPVMIKIPSATNTHFEVLNYLSENYQGEIHLSLGMTTKEEEKKIVNLFIEKNRISDLVLYACTSGYPVPFDQIHLLGVKRLREEYGHLVKAIGFSGHHNGIAIDIAAQTLGASYIERHFTLNRTFKGTDHAASLEPDGLRRLKRNIDATFDAMTYKPEEIVDIELPQRKKLKYHG
jgi:N-acetylneuraminate synthase